MPGATEKKKGVGKSAVQELTPASAARYLDQLAPDAICEALRPQVTDGRIARIESVLEQRLARLTVVVQNLHDPRNGAAAMRSAEAVGLQDFHAIEEREEFWAARGITMTADQWMDLHRHADTSSCYDSLRQAGFTIWAAAPTGAVPLEEVPVDRPLALVFGNERDGLTEQGIKEADGAFVLAMQGFTGSYNLSVSVAISAYQQAARVREALGGVGDLPPARVARLRALWYCLSVRAARLILDQVLADGEGAGRAPR